jgi:thiaminase/transcriptional activator TenA
MRNRAILSYMDSFCQQIRRQGDPVWKAILEHPFVQGIGSGTLPRDCYEFFLKQDYLYLIEFSRMFAVLAAKAERLAEMAYFAKLLDVTLNTEMDLHRRTCADFGIPAGDLEQTKLALVTQAYTDFLVKAAYQESLAGGLAALLPCAWGYVTIGKELIAKSLPKDPHYRAWIETYASREFEEVSDWLKAKLDAFAVHASQDEREHWNELFQRSSRFEWMFFEMAWRKDLGWLV